MLSHRFAPLLLLLLFILPSGQVAIAQSFTKIDVNFLNVWNSNAAWGDYDDDGDLDILVTGENRGGEGVSTIIRNDNAVFRETAIGLEPLRGGSGAWGDYDNDGDLDLLLTGTNDDFEDVSLIYQNTGGDFVLMPAGLSGASHGAWGDYDNDGDLDLLLVGSINLNPFSKVYRNDNGQFSNIGVPIRGVHEGRARWGDIDSDGDLDILISGHEQEGTFSPMFSIYLNNDGDFTYAQLSSWLNDSNSHAAFGDFDNDGKLDLLRAQYSQESNNTVQSDIISIADPTIPGPTGIDRFLYSSSNLAITDAIWGDMDNDGDMDAIIPNLSTNTYRLFTYAGGQLIDTGYDLDTLAGHEVTLVDYDNDNDIDFLVTGNGKACVHRNNITSSNTSPSPPGQTSQLLSNSRRQALLSWGAGSDKETSTSGLTYNLRVGTSPQSNDILSSMALANGQRKVIDPNTVIHATNRTLIDLKPATYFWSVQTLDHTHASSPFTEEDVFSTVFTANDNILGTLNQFGSVEWGDFDNDNDLDLLINNDLSGSSRKTIIYRNDNGNFVDIGANLEGDSFGATWADYDNDGDLDILIYGLENLNGSYTTKIYINEFNSYFETDILFPSNFWIDANWGDFDRDGDLDILFSEFGETGTTSVFRNDGNTFTDIELDLPGPSTNRSHVDFGDYDADGDLDILLVHCDIEDAFNKSSSCIFINDDSQYSRLESFLVNPLNGVATWGDYDNDGDLDVFVEDNGLCILENEEGSLSELDCFTEGNSGERSTFIKPTLGDFDNDGDIDFYSASTGIHRNDGGSFLQINAGLDSDIFHTALWGDYDRDGDQDILTAGLNARFHRNDGAYSVPSTNNTPTPPLNLSVESGESSVTLSWNPGQDQETPTNGLTYNIYVGTRPGGNDVVSPLSLENGVRLVQSAGNIGHQTSWRITGLLPGRTYYWGVQTIDSVHDGSEFIEGPSFIPEGIAPPVNIAAITSDEGIQIAWKEIEDAAEVSSYQLLRRIQTPNFISTTLDSTGSAPPGQQEFVDVNVEIGSGYAYRILAEDQAGRKTNASEETFTYKVPFDDSLIPFDSTLQSAALFELDLDDYFSDLPDGELIYSTLTLPDEVASSRIVQDNRNTLIVVPKNVGNARVLVQVHNERGEGIATGFNIMINAVPSVAQNLPTQYVPADAPPFSIDLASLFQSNDGSGLAYSFAISDETIATLDQSQDSTLLVTLSPGIEVGAATSIEITATNTLGGSASLSFDLVIDARPSITAPSLPADGSVSEQSDFVLVAEINDDSGLESAIIHFRLGGERQFFTAEMTRSSDEPNTFEYIFPEVVINEQGLEYFITAQDIHGLESRYPESNSISVPVTLPTGITRNTIQPFGTAQNAYRLVSFPVDIDEDKRNARRVMENVLGEYDPIQWRFFALNEGQTFVEIDRSPGLEITPGEAYLLIVRENRPALFTPSGKTVRTDQLFDIPLHPGWNIIGNPFNFDIPMVNLYRESGNPVDFRIYQTDSENSVTPMWQTVPETGSIVPFEGYAIHNDSNENDVIYIDPNLTSEDISDSVSKTSESSDSLHWSIQIQATNQEARDIDNWIGTSRSALPGKDFFDRVEPPSVGEYVSVYFDRPEWESVAQRFQADVRPEITEGEVWDFEVETNIKDVVELRFEGLEGVPDGYEVWLVDELVNVSHNLREQPSYRLSASGTRSLKLVVGNADFATETLAAQQGIPAEYALSQNFPNPFSGSTTITYSLPEESPVRVEVFNILGQKVATLVDSASKPAGQHAIAWNAGKARSGAYLVRIEARGFRQMMKMVVIK